MKLKKLVAVVFVTITAVQIFSTSVYASNVIDSHRKDGIPAYTTKELQVMSEDSKERLGSIPAGTAFRYVENTGDTLKIAWGQNYGFVKGESVLRDHEVAEYAIAHRNMFSVLVRVHKDKANLFSETTQKTIAVAQKDTVFLAEDTLDYFYKVSFDGKSALLSKEDVDSSIYVKMKSFKHDVLDIQSLAAQIQNARESVQAAGAKIRNAEYKFGLEVCSLVREQIVRYALQFVGNPYVWGGTSLTDGADCSGFTGSVFAHFGVTLPRCSWQQADVGKRVTLGELQPGDLVFYKHGAAIGHVAMYAGNGKVVHAKGSRYGITVTDMNYNTPYCAVDVISDYLER